MLMGKLMKTMLLPSTRAGNIALGAVGTVALATVGRPLLVGIVKTGYSIKDVAWSAWQTAKAEAEKIKGEAESSPWGQDIEDEVRKLREEIAALKSKKAS